MNIEVNERTYRLLQREANKTTQGNIGQYLEELIIEITEIIPSKKEKQEWKQNLYDTCMFLATERPQFRPRKKDSLNDLKDLFFSWAEQYNEGYFSERDEADSDKYCAWLVQEYEKYANKGWR